MSTGVVTTNPTLSDIQSNLCKVFDTSFNDFITREGIGKQNYFLCIGGGRKRNRISDTSDFIERISEILNDLKLDPTKANNRHWELVANRFFDSKCAHRDKRMTQMMNMYYKNREAIGSRCFAASAPSPPVSDIPDTADRQFDQIENSSNADNPNGPTEPQSMLDDLKSPFLADAQCLDLPEPCVDENGDN